MRYDQNKYNDPFTFRCAVAFSCCSVFLEKRVFLRRGFVGHKQMMSGTIGMSATPNKGMITHLFYETNDNERARRGACLEECIVRCLFHAANQCQKFFPFFLFKWIREKDFLVWIGFVRRCSWTVGHLKYWNRTPFFEWCIGCTVERKAHLGCQDILLGAPTLSDWHGQIITLKGTCRHQARMTLPFAILGRKRPCAQTV